METQKQAPRRAHRISCKPDRDVLKSAGNRTIYAMTSAAIREGVERCVREFAPVRKARIPLEEGPFADKEGEVQALTETVRDVAGRMKHHTEREDDKLAWILHYLFFPVNAKGPVPREHKFEEKFYLGERIGRESPRLMTAGEILGSERGGQREDLIVISYPELLTLGVSVLRRLGYEAYVGAPIPSPKGEDSIKHRMIVVYGEEQGERRLLPYHPEWSWEDPIEGMHILDDIGLYAEARAMEAREWAWSLKGDTMKAIKEVLRSCYLGALVEAMEQGQFAKGKRTLGPMDLVDRVPKPAEEFITWLVGQRYLTPGQAETFQGRFRNWEHENLPGGTDSKIYKLVVALKQALLLFPDSPVLPFTKRILDGQLTSLQRAAVEQGLGSLEPRIEVLETLCSISTILRETAEVIAAERSSLPGAEAKG